MGLQQRASLYGGLGLVFLVGILVSLGVWVVRDTTERSLNERVAVAQMVSRGVDQALLEARDELVTLAGMINLQDDNGEVGLQALSNLYAFSGTLSHVFLVDAAGKVIDSQPIVLSPLTQALVDADAGLVQVLTTARDAITCVSMSPPDDEPMFSISVPIYGRDGRLVGAVSAHMDLYKVLGTFMEPLGLGGTAYMQVMNEDGTVMASSGSAVASPGETEYAPHFASLILKSEATMSKCFGCHDSGEGVSRTPEVLAFAPLTAVPGGVAIRQSEAEALAPSHRLLRYMLLAGSPLLLLGLVFTWMSMRTVVRPVVELTTASRNIAQGDLDTSIAVNRSDELGQLAETFDQMRLALKRSLAEMEDRATESERRARHLSMLNLVAGTASRSLDLEQILEDGLEQVLQVLPVLSGCVCLAGDGAPQPLVKARRNMTEKWLDLIPWGDQEAGRAAELVVYDRITDGEAMTLVRVPLISKAQSLGEMWLVSDGPQGFTREELDLLASIGRQIGVAIHNAQLFQEAERREREAQGLRQLGLEVSRLLDLDRVLTTVVDSIVHLLKSDGAVVALHDDKSGQVYVQSVSGSLPPEFRSFRADVGEDGLIGRVITSGRPLSTVDYLNDTSITHGAAMDSLVRSSGLRSWLVVPMTIGERVSGVLMALFRQVPGFSRQETELLQQLANQAAVALENARLHSQVQELAIVEERARLSREMHDSLGQVLAYVGLETDETMRLLASGEQERATAKMGEMGRLVREASEELRDTILALRTPASPEVELPSMLRQYIESFRKLSSADISVDVRDEEATRFTRRAALELLRVIQEALSNVRRHAEASRVHVVFEMDGDEAVVGISDDGVGFAVADVYSGGQRFGIQVMRERMVALGGSLDIDSHLGKGTRVTARLPLEVGIGERGSPQSPNS